ncbi:MAG: prepilin-type N-terminal cleavage/methylation domain-containing protein [Succiniclasticum sp.]|nr:prepilin-type N-terminal cleavage/methylation domain-containing protein [Succiniclasticum sp.]
MKRIFFSKLHKREGNGGYTLVELIVSIAILGVVMVGAFALMTSGGNQFARINGRIDLQYAAQQALSHMGQEVIDTDAGMVYETAAKADGSGPDKDYIMLVDRKVTGSDKEYTVHTYVLEDGKIYYNEAAYSGSLPTNVGTVKQNTVNAGHILAEHVTALTFTPTAVSKPTDTGTVELVKSLKIEMTMERRKQTYEGSQVTSLRNRVLHGESLSALESALNPPAPAAP